jgi:hypothetical protein
MVTSQQGHEHVSCYLAMSVENVEDFLKLFALKVS